LHQNFQDEVGVADGPGPSLPLHYVHADCRYQRKMFYESSSSYSDTYCTLPSVFKHRLSFQGNEIDSNEVVIKVAEEEGILVVIAPKKSQTSGDICDYDSSDGYFHPEVSSF